MGLIELFRFEGLVVGLHQPPWSFVFDSQTRGRTNKRHHHQNRAPPCVKVPGSSRVPVRDGQTSPHRPRFVVSRSTCPPVMGSPLSLATSELVLGAAVINSSNKQQPEYTVLFLELSFLYHVVRDTPMSRSSALAWTPF